MMFGQALPCHLGEKSLKLMRPNSGSRLVKSEVIHGSHHHLILLNIHLRTPALRKWVLESSLFCFQWVSCALRDSWCSKQWPENVHRSTGVAISCWEILLLATRSSAYAKRSDGTRSRHLEQKCAHCRRQGRAEWLGAGGRGSPGQEQLFCVGWFVLQKFCSSLCCDLMLGIPPTHARACIDTMYMNLRL